MQIVNLTIPVIHLSTQLCVKYRLRTPDALQIASAKHLIEKCLFVTVDKKLQKIDETDCLILEK
ncbi:MAG: PIN domain-containing protein [Thiotrichaceae bacterium]|nr:PIN domain-containing protein [Thiotrichaceae bacterium]